MGGQRSDPAHWLCTNVRHLLRRIDDLELQVASLSSHNLASVTSSYSKVHSVDDCNDVEEVTQEILPDISHDYESTPIPHFCVSGSTSVQQEEVVKQVIVPQHQEVFDMCQDLHGGPGTGINR